MLFKLQSHYNKLIGKLDKSQNHGSCIENKRNYRQKNSIIITAQCPPGITIAPDKKFKIN